MFVGTVGAGKSTQINQLHSVLKKAGIRVTATVLKRGHFLTHILEMILAKLILHNFKDESYPIEVIVKNRPVILKKLFKLFLILDTISIFCRFVFTIYIPKKIGYIVIVEEYIQAAIADYMALSQVVGTHNSPLFNRMLASLSFLGGPTYTIFLDAPDKTLKQRWIYRRSPVQRNEYLMMQRTLLFNISKKLSSCFFYINTENKPVNKTGATILNFLQAAQLNMQAVSP